MKQEYEQKIELAKKMLIFDPDLSDEQNDEHFDVAFKIVNKLLLIQDTEILGQLLEFFTVENEEYGGFCEHLKSKIGNNFSLDEILEAFYKKFDFLIKNDIEMAVEMSMWFFDGGKFDEFRKMFNSVKSKKSEDFLNEFVSWYPDLEEGVNILRDDMQKW